MTELTYYKALSAIFYMIIAVMYYRKLKKGIQKDKNREFAELCNELELDEHTGLAATKTAAAVLCLFWPIAVLTTAYKRKGDRK